MISNNTIKIQFKFNNHDTHTHIENMIIIGGECEQNLLHLSEIILSKFPIKTNKND